MYRAPVDCDDVDIPVAADLARLLEGAVTVRLREGGVVDGRSLGGRLLAEVSGDGLDELCGLLRLAEGGRPFHCMCHGDLAVEVEGPGGAVAIGVHHGLTLRLPGFSSDVELADGRALLAWLASRGEPGPLEAFDAAVEAGRAAQGHRRRWVEATPPVLVPRLRELEGDGMGLPRRSGDPAHVEALELLRSAYSDEAGLVRALLVWLACGAGPWSGFPSYEALPAVLLQAAGVPRVIEAAEEGAWTERLLAGLARFVAGHEVIRFRRRDLVGLDEALWERMVDQVRSAGNEDIVVAITPISYLS